MPPDRQSAGGRGAGTDGADEAVSGAPADGDAPTGADGGGPVAALWPWSGRGDGDAVTVTVYVVSGRHGRLRIPESFCRECHRFVRAADAAAERVDRPVAVRVRSWWTHLPWALRRGGYHPPVMVVGSRRLCQGYDVPSPERVVEAIEEVS
ncbi:MAG: hypothetical protein ABEJ08_05865 [Halobacteriaceae archaeon]